MNVCVFQKKKKGSICSEMPLSCFSANFPQAVLSPGEIPNPWDFFQPSSSLWELQAPNQEADKTACCMRVPAGWREAVCLSTPSYQIPAAGAARRAQGYCTELTAGGLGRKAHVALANQPPLLALAPVRCRAQPVVLVFPMGLKWGFGSGMEGAISPRHDCGDMRPARGGSGGNLKGNCYFLNMLYVIFLRDQQAFWIFCYFLVKGGGFHFPCSREVQEGWRSRMTPVVEQPPGGMASQQHG